MTANAGPVPAAADIPHEASSRLDPCLQERAALHLLLRVQQQALREAAALQQRLAACNLEHAASGTAGDLQPGQALGVLDTLDGRLQVSFACQAHALHKHPL